MHARMHLLAATEDLVTINVVIDSETDHPMIAGILDLMGQTLVDEA